MAEFASALWSERSAPEVAARRSELAQVIWDIRRGIATLSEASTKGLRYGPTTARALIQAATKARQRKIVLDGQICGELSVGSDVTGALVFNGDVAGLLAVSGSVGNLNVNGRVFALWVRDSSLVGNLRIDGDVANNVYLAGTVTGVVFVSGSVGGDFAVVNDVGDNVTIGEPVGGNVYITSPIGGDFGVLGPVTGNMHVGQTVRGNVTVEGGVGGYLSFDDAVGGGVDVKADVGGSLHVGGTVGDNLFVGGTVGGRMDVSEEVHGNLVTADSIGGTLTITGAVGGNLIVTGSVDGHLYVAGTVGRSLMVSGTVDGNLNVNKMVRGDLSVAGAVGGKLSCHAAVGGYLHMTGSFTNEVRLLPKSGIIKLATLSGSRFEMDVYVGNGVQIDECDFRRCSDIDQLNLIGSDLFPKGVSALANPPQGEADRVPDREMASIYRQLRSNVEKRNNRPGAGLFYRNELHSRRKAAIKSGRLSEWATLSGYRALSGYGMVASLPVFWFALTTVIGAWWLRLDGLNLADNPSAPRIEASVMQATVFTLKSMVSFFRPPAAVLSGREDLIQIGLRFLGPILIAQTILAIRERVAR